MTAITASIDRFTFLRRVFSFDAITCVAMGLLLSLGSVVLAPLLGLPRLLLEGVGLALFPIAAFIAWVATSDNLSRSGAWTIIAANVLWVVGSAGLLISDVMSPSPLGSAFVVLQAIAIALLTELEYIGLRKS
jgi:hypothetical protein